MLLSSTSTIATVDRRDFLLKKFVALSAQVAQLSCVLVGTTQSRTPRGEDNDDDITLSSSRHLTLTEPEKRTYKDVVLHGCTTIPTPMEIGNVTPTRLGNSIFTPTEIESINTRTPTKE